MNVWMNGWKACTEITRPECLLRALALHQTDSFVMKAYMWFFIHFLLLFYFHYHSIFIIILFSLSFYFYYYFILFILLFSLLFCLVYCFFILIFIFIIVFFLLFLLHHSRNALQTKLAQTSPAALRSLQLGLF